VTLRALKILGGRSAQLWPPLVRQQLFFEFETLCVVALHLAREQMQQRQQFPHEQESLRLFGPVALGDLESNGGRSDQLRPQPVHVFSFFFFCDMNTSPVVALRLARRADVAATCIFE